ncbi:SHOCT domain-containing protein [Halomontanus rarus]|uniref:SHOCT domain-containing protein n=1 Tax=Halomontanus rarus TaxID=3034020 RepID=UPI0023E7FE2E|nr:SHOCT domain-containing protein [Halovivax sp. TS33]
MNDGPSTRFRENATEITSTVVTGIWLAAMFTGQSWWLGALLFGYIVVVPIVALLFGDESDRREWWDDWSSDESWGEWWGESEPAHAGRDETEPTTDNRDALETLRERYARGELTDEQFERKLERLLETDTLENADEWVRESRVERERRAGRDRNRDCEDEREYEYR